MFLLVLYISVALIFSFFCSIAEAVLLSVTPTYIVTLKEKGKRAGKILFKLKTEINRPLAAILTLNTIAHTIGAAGAGAQAAVVFGSAYVGIASAILTLLILVFSEIIPKTLGANYWRFLAPLLAYPLKVMVWSLFPFVVLSEKLTQSISPEDKIKSLNREEIIALAELGLQEGLLGSKESKIIKNLFLLRSSKVTSIMTPRTVLFALEENLTIAECIEKYTPIPFSRIPIYQNDIDHITGFILKGDILLAHARREHDAKLLKYKRSLEAIPNTNTIFQLFEFLLDRREHITLVVDEHGGVEGVVTLEDVVETLLGLEIVDEADRTVDMQALARSLWENRAKRMGIIPVKEDQVR